MTARLLRYCIVNFRAIRVERCRDIDVMFHEAVEKRLWNSRQVREDFNELIIELARLRDKVREISIEGRLAADELHLPAAELGSGRKGSYVVVGLETIVLP